MESCCVGCLQHDFDRRARAASQLLGKTPRCDQHEVGLVALGNVDGVGMADDPEHVRLSGRPANAAKTTEHAMDVAGPRRQIVGVIERLHAHEMAERAQRPRERLCEVPVAPPGCDLRGRRGDRERDSQPIPRQRRGVAHERGAVSFDVTAPRSTVRCERPCERTRPAHRAIVDDDCIRYRDDAAASGAETPAQLEDGDVGVLAFGEPTHARLQKGLDNYMQLVMNVEWPLMRTGGHSQAAYHAGYDVLNIITSLKPKSSEEIMLQSKALDAANDFLDYRRQRLHANEDGIPGLLWAALIFVGCMVVIFSYYFRVDNRLEQRLMVGALAAVIAVVMLLIAEFDYPFRGDIAVKPTAFQHTWNSLHNLQGGY